MMKKEMTRRDETEMNALCESFISQIKDGKSDNSFLRVYGTEGLEAGKERMIQTLEHFGSSFSQKEKGSLMLFSAPGRTEIGGNHEDHQNGKVICASVDLDMTACVAENGLSKIRILSKGYPEVSVALDDLEPKDSDRFQSSGLVKGIACGIKKMGYELKGFDAAVLSQIQSGSGLSSSAAYEVLIASILNHICCSDQLSQEQMARLSQYAENTYFGKPCGLMDQMACAVGGLVYIDFENPQTPSYEKLNCDFSKSGYALCIVETNSGHQDLSEEYAAIPREMNQVAEYFGRTKLREVESDSFFAAIPQIRKQCGDRAVLRAMHFFEEKTRVENEKSALCLGEFDAFLKLVTESGNSSEMLLQNTRSEGSGEKQEVQVALAIAKKLLGGKGAVRVHGGGFAGMIQAFVPKEQVLDFAKNMEVVFGAGSCHLLKIRPTGACLIAERT